MSKKIFAVLLAVLAGFVTIGLGEYLSARLFPMPDGLDMTDPEAMRAYVATVPLTAKLIVLASWFAGAFVAGFVGAKADCPRRGMIAGAILMVAGIANLFMVPHPLWMGLIGIAQYLPMARFGTRLGVRA